MTTTGAILFKNSLPQQNISYTTRRSITYSYHNMASYLVKKFQISNISAAVIKRMVTVW